MRVLLAILLLLLGPGRALWAQDLTGQWTGTAIDNLSGAKEKLVLNISSADSAFGGVLHWYFPERHYIRHIIISGRYYGKDSVLTIRDDSVLRGKDVTSSAEGDNTGHPPGGFYILYFKRINHRDILEGRWQSPPNEPNTGSSDLSIRLEKKAPPFVPIILPSHKKKDSAQQKQFETLQSRESVVVAHIPSRGTDSVKIALYDNGEIDGDSVSLYLNDEMILQHLRLTEKAKTLIIPIDKSLPVNKLTLFAENLGRLPPNTALMEVTIHGKTYDLFLSTDYKRNATVEFNLQE